MKIQFISNDRRGLRVRLVEEGITVAMDVKHGLLEYGVAVLRPSNLGDLPDFKTRAIVHGGVELDVMYGTTDPVLVCLARRAWTAGNLDGGFRFIQIPTMEEAMQELRSGKDVYGRTWAVPLATPETLEETLRRARLQ